jgi:hypothetical protein
MAFKAASNMAASLSFLDSSGFMTRLDQNLIDLSIKFLEISFGRFRAVLQSLGWGAVGYPLVIKR